MPQIWLCAGCFFFVAVVDWVVGDYPRHSTVVETHLGHPIVEAVVEAEQNVGEERTVAGRFGVVGSFHVGLTFLIMGF